MKQNRAIGSIAASMLLVAGCGGVADLRSESFPEPAPSPASAPEAASTDPTTVAAIAATGATRIMSFDPVTPPEGVGPSPSNDGSSLWFDVTVKGTEGADRVESDWQAARAVGRYRQLARAAKAPLPLGSTVNYITPDGVKRRGDEVVLGLDITPAQAPKIRSAAEIQDAAAGVGLTVERLERVGDDEALLVVVRSMKGTAADIIANWPSIFSAVIGAESDASWLLAVSSADGATVKVLSQAPSAGARRGWVDPAVAASDSASAVTNPAG